MVNKKNPKKMSGNNIVDKKEAAKKKADNLLKDIVIGKPLDVIIQQQLHPMDMIETKKNDNANQWLQDQLDSLNTENEQLRSKLSKLNSVGNDNAELEQFKKNMVIVFNELEANLLGLNKEKTPWVNTRIEYLLNKLVGFFPFLIKR